MDEADRVLKDAVKLHPRPALLLLRAAGAYRDKGDVQRSLACLEMAHGADAKNGDVELALGEALMQRGRIAEGIQHLETARDGGVAPLTASCEIVAALASLDRIEEARRLIRQVPTQSDVPTSGLMDFGDLAMRLEDPRTAERFFTQVVSREPRDWRARDALGVALGAQEKTGAALTELETAKRLAPGEATVRFHIGLTLAQAGRLDEARGELGEALRLQPDCPEAKEVLALATRGGR